MSDKNGENCQNCRFGATAEVRTGFICRRNPPNVSFPLVRGDDWCGEWRAQKTYPMISCFMGIFEGDQVMCKTFPDEVFAVRLMVPSIDGSAHFAIEANGRTEVVNAAECRRIEAGE